MITTLSEKRYNLLLDEPALKELSTFGLQISVADGSILQFKGYIECIISLLDIELLVPIVIFAIHLYFALTLKIFQSVHK